MSVYSWIIPGPTPVSSGGGSGSTTGAKVPGVAGRDLELDPITRDAIDTDDGAWSEVNDSRTAVLMQLEIEFGTWWVDPNAGSTIAELLRSGDPVTVEELIDRAQTALQVLVLDGLITDLEVSSDVDESGELRVVLLSYRDRASGRVVDTVYSPFGG